MTYDPHIVWGTIAVIIGIVSYVPYYRDVLAGKTKPHPFTWSLWVMMDFTVLTAQFLNGAGAGAWATGVTAFLATGVVILAWRNGKQQIVSLDKWFFAAGLFGIALWILTSNALYAILIASLTNITAMIPTIRKSYVRPNEETLSLYILAIFKWVPAILALESVTLVTWLYPAVIVVLNTLFVLVVLFRRRALRLIAHV